MLGDETRGGASAVSARSLGIKLRLRNERRKEPARQTTPPVGRAPPTLRSESLNPKSGGWGGWRGRATEPAWYRRVTRSYSKKFWKTKLLVPRAGWAVRVATEGHRRLGLCLRSASTERVSAKGWEVGRGGSAVGRVTEGLFGIDECEGRPTPETGRDKPGAIGE